MSKEMFMIEELVKEMALILIDEKGMSMMDALDAIYNSDTCSSLINLKSGLYSQSTAYVYEYLDNELSTGSMN
jgi:hypothetical protein